MAWHLPDGCLVGRVSVSPQVYPRRFFVHLTPGTVRGYPLQNTGESQLKKILVAREPTRADAWLRKDRWALEALLGPGYTEINAAGRFTRQNVLNHFFPATDLRAFNIPSQELVLAGPDAAALTYCCHENLIVDGRGFMGMFFVSALYARDGSWWQIVL